MILPFRLPRFMRYLLYRSILPPAPLSPPPPRPRLLGGQPRA